jgi:hypothetical protein
MLLHRTLNDIGKTDTEDVHRIRLRKERNLQINVLEYLSASAAKDPDKIVFSEENKTISFWELTMPMIGLSMSSLVRPIA